MAASAGVPDAPVTASALLREATATLAGAGIESPAAEARWLVAHVLGAPPAQFTGRVDD